MTRTVVRNGKRVQEQVPQIRWQPASGRVARFFDDVLVLASRALPKTFTDALEPWDLPALEPYQPEYLAGFRAEAYTVSLQDGYAEARAHMDRVIERDVRFDIGGDRQRIHAIDTEIRDVTFKHILLPVWLAAYRYPRPHLPLRGQRPHRPGSGRAAVVGGEDRLRCPARPAGRGRDRLAGGTAAIDHDRVGRTASPLGKGSRPSRGWARSRGMARHAWLIVT